MLRNKKLARRNMMIERFTTFRFAFVAFAAMAVKNVEDPTLTAIHSESLLHDVVHERNDARVRKVP